MIDWIVSNISWLTTFLFLGGMFHILGGVGYICYYLDVSKLTSLKMDIGLTIMYLGVFYIFSTFVVLGVKFL